MSSLHASRPEWIVFSFDTFEHYVCADESGVHDNPDFCVVAGYYGSARLWRDFEKAWGDVLGQHDVRDFHCKDYFAFDRNGGRTGKYVSRATGEQRPYGDWPDSALNEMEGQLLEVIDGQALQPIGAAVDVHDFEILTERERRYVTGGLPVVTCRGSEPIKGRWRHPGAPTKPYFAALLVVMANVSIEIPGEERVFFVLDEHREFEGGATALFEVARARVGLHQDRPVLGGVTFERRENVGGLQAADLWAHHWHRALTQGQLGQPRLRIMNRLTARQNKIWRLTGGTFDKAMAGLDPRVRAWLAGQGS